MVFQKQGAVQHVTDCFTFPAPEQFGHLSVFGADKG
jgi:hypothetical protein